MDAKALWIIFVILLPYLGVFDLPDREPRRDGGPEHPADAERNSSRRTTTSSLSPDGGSAAEIEKAKGLLDSGAITQAEFDTIKQKALAS